MNTLKLSATLLGAAAALVAGALQPAQAQYYGYGNGWRQPMQSGPVMRPTQSGASYLPNRSVMQQPSFGQPRRLPSQQGFGHTSGSYFGW
jgi:hypothetical protein